MNGWDLVGYIGACLPLAVIIAAVAILNWYERDH